MFFDYAYIVLIFNRLRRWLLALLTILLAFNINLIANKRINLSDSVPDFYKENYLRYSNFIYKDNIKTLLIYKSGWELSNPIIELNSNEQIKLSFDDLDADVKNLRYKIVHCNSDWTPSDISYYDYLEGFEENILGDYKFSFNTFQKFTHYNLLIPNDDVKFKISGNYLIKVYDGFDEENLLVTARFLCVEKKAQIDATCNRAMMPDIALTHQQVSFKVSTPINIPNPQNELKTVILQNFRWDNCISGLKPLFISNNEYNYNNTEGNCFTAGTEYHYFDIKSIRYQAERIAGIEYRKPFYYVDLVQDSPLRFKNYIFNSDLNGKYVVKIQEGEDSETDADYVFVNYTLPYDYPLIDGNIYVIGGFNNWQFIPENKMNYNFEKKQYELSLKLKQGYYNYQYAFVKDGTNLADNTFIDGSHYETENEYLILVYLRENSSRYDKLIGYQVVNSNVK